MRTFIAALLAATIAVPASAQALRPDQQAFRALYKELVETNTTVSTGSCNLAAERMATLLWASRSDPPASDRPTPILSPKMMTLVEAAAGALAATSIAAATRACLKGDKLAQNRRKQFLNYPNWRQRTLPLAA
jgi:hypothetical protein